MSAKCDYPIVRSTALYGIMHDKCGKPAKSSVDGKFYCSKHLAQVTKKGKSK